MYLIADASVIIKWFIRLKENDRKQALVIKKQMLEGKFILAAPDLLFYEVINVLTIKRMVRKTSLDRMIKLLFQYPFEIIWPSGELFESAAKLAKRFDLTIYDAVYLALAQELDCPLVTADNKLYQNSLKIETKLLRNFKI